MFPRMHKFNRIPRETTTHRTAPAQSFVELAIILPILLLMLTGMLEIGRATYATISIAHAARDGARIAMDPKVTDDAVKQRVVNSARPFTVNKSDVTISNRSAGSAVTVTVSYSFASIVPMVHELWGGDDLVLTRSRVARVQE